MARSVSETITCDQTGKEIAPENGRVVVRVEYFPGTPEDGPTFEAQQTSRDFSSLAAMVKGMPAVVDELEGAHQEVLDAREASRLEQERAAEEERRNRPPEPEVEEASGTRKRRS